MTTREEELSAQVAMLRELAEKVMEEHDEETTGSQSLDNFINAAMAPDTATKWLAEHDAKVRAEARKAALEEAAMIAQRHVIKWLDIANDDDALPGDRHQHRAMAATAQDVASELLRALAQGEKPSDCILVPRVLLENARRLLFYSAKELRKEYGDAPLCELVSEEHVVGELEAVLGPMPGEKP